MEGFVYWALLVSIIGVFVLGYFEDEDRGKLYGIGIMTLAFISLYFIKNFYISVAIVMCLSVVSLIISLLICSKDSKEKA